MFFLGHAQRRQIPVPGNRGADQRGDLRCAFGAMPYADSGLDGHLHPGGQLAAWIDQTKDLSAQLRDRRQFFVLPLISGTSERPWMVSPGLPPASSTSVGAMSIARII